MTHPTTDPRLSEIRKVELAFHGTSPSSYLVLESEVERFVEACKRLHYKPGVNPHNGAQTAKLWKISVGPLEFNGPYWWTVPSLARNDDPDGARIIDCYGGKVVFIDPDDEDEDD